MEAHAKASSSGDTAARDPFYGHRTMAEVAERMLMALFSCSHDSMVATADAKSVSSSSVPRLAHFIAYALYRTRLPLVVTYYALVLLKRLKTRYPVARGSSGHRLFISALMLASKMLCDDSYNNKSWTIVGQGLFALEEVNQMERELLTYLNLHLDVPMAEIAAFAAELEMYGAPPVTMDALCASVKSRAQKEAPTPAAEPPRPVRAATTRRRPSHQRAHSLRPDYWTHPSSAAPYNALSAPYRAESDWSLHHRTSRPNLRTSLPAQRNQAMHGAHGASMASMAPVPPRPLLPEPAPTDWNAMYAAANTSSWSMTTPGSMVSSTHMTPSTSSDMAPSPWTGLHSLGTALPHATAGYPPRPMPKWDEPRPEPPMPYSLYAP